MRSHGLLRMGVMAVRLPVTARPFLRTPHIHHFSSKAWAPMPYRAFVLDSDMIEGPRLHTRRERAIESESESESEEDEQEVCN